MTEADRKRWNERHTTRPEMLADGPDDLLVLFRHLLSGGDALDLACGLGQNALWLAEQGYRVDAVDISDVAIDRLRDETARRGLNVRAIRADLDDYTLPVAAYDLVIVFYFLDRRIAPNLAAALSPGGLMIYETFNVRHMVGRSGTKPTYFLEIGEMRQLFAELEVIWDSDAATEARTVSSLIARKAVDL